MAAARQKLDWEKKFDICLDPEKARQLSRRSQSGKRRYLHVCGNFCAVKNMNRILDGEIVNIYDE